MRAAYLALLAGCSFTMDKAPESPELEAEPKCTESKAAAGLDFIGAGALGLIGIASEEARVPLLGGAAVLAIAGVVGTHWANECREARGTWKQRGGEAVVETAPAVAAAPETTAAVEPEPELRPLPTPQQQPAVEKGAACAPGSRCPSGAHCDPLTHTCVRTRAERFEGGPCDQDAGCGAGLYCDLDARVCRPGDLGLEGGRCQAGGRCLEGLSCRAGLCVRSPRSRSGPR